ncbi:hypothetical protein [Nonomuraea sp. SYSU D8015]|uniref:hypothetical protein n=1 Tax=Nonomuraea sp. SYSU D8015 TaxID=2593644 RepID=UPI001CB75653|nr:hypothetical protein [Nonomuraea sp. SYSU D8015]
MSRRRRGGRNRYRRYGTSPTRTDSAGPRPAAVPASGSRTPGSIGKLLIIVMWAGMCLVPIPLWVPQVQLAAGGVGTPGSLTVAACEHLYRSRYRCGGTFTPDAGGPAITVRAPADLEAGDTARAQLTPEGDRAALAGPRGVLGSLILPFLCVGLFGFLPYVVLYWSSRATRRHLDAAVIVGWTLTAVSVVGVTGGLIAIYSI